MTAADRRLQNVMVQVAHALVKNHRYSQAGAVHVVNAKASAIKKLDADRLGPLDIADEISPRARTK